MHLALKTCTNAGMMLLLGVLAVSILPGCRHASDMKGIVIKNGIVLTMNGTHDVIVNGSVVIQGDRIMAAGTPETIKKRHPGFKVIDADGGIVMPGLINTHSHLPMIAFRGLAENGVRDRLFNYFLPLERNMLSRELIYHATIHGAVEYAMGGITTYADMYYHMDEMARATKKVGVRAVLGETVIKYPVVDAPEPYGGLEYAVDFIREYRDDSLVTPALAPHAPYSVSKEKLLETISVAGEYQVPVLIHVAERSGEPDMLPGKYKGKSSVFYLDDIGFLRKNVHMAHAIHLDDQDLEILKRVQCGVAHSPISNAKSGHGIARVHDMMKAGVRVGLATDGPMSNNSLNLFATMRAAALLQRVKHQNNTLMRPEEILEMATIGGARSLYMDDEIGSIEVGKLADIIVIETKSPNMVPCYDYYAAVVFQAEPWNVTTTIINGKIVMENREMKTIDLREDLETMNRLKEDIAPFARELDIK
jgi:cytosine/adenosine deaminase-related metal-dependent hydrolase